MLKKSFLKAIIVCTVLMAAQSSYSSNYNLPEMGGPESEVLSPAQELAISGQMAREIRRSLPVIDDPELSTYLSSVGARLVTNSQDANNPMIFLLINSGEINAFAAPGGVIAVNTGLILASENESELAGVMAHEIAHVTQRHLARTFANQSSVTLKTGLALLAGLLLGAYNADLGSAAMMGGLAASQESQLKYSRSNEQEADRIGIITLASAGYDPHGMPRFFKTLLNETGQSSDKIIEYLQTHPLTSSRITDSMFRADQYLGNFELTSNEYIFARARVRSLIEKPNEIIRDYKSRGSAFQPDEVARYTYALALTRNGDPQRAVKTLEPMSKKEHNLAIDLALAEAWIAANHNQKAIQHLSRLYQIYPTNSAVTYLLAKSHLQHGNPDKAVALLVHELSREAETPAMYRLLAKAANIGDQKVISYEAMAEYYFAQGRYAEAMTQIKRALDVYELSEIERQRIESKQDILETWLTDK